ncbi:Protein of unknown function [Pseudidiomarina planktonica]|uniref:DUF3108 domain-containing protein n=1 Tax=Pseudidiomarina planktonica TaxID=1323738 RepID=A0A1Y6EUW6_9GAMM|nr:DUF3108 domain-containing protein [Pseudidiomarina planktonica]RUO65094.1 DUF3108 domain-containing protein [Pseudidiomarina planktonica]SMQ66514.1 Protein of unknown function [Pseudidiomarina planktonica]
MFLAPKGIGTQFTKLANLCVVAGFMMATAMPAAATHDKVEQSDLTPFKADYVVTRGGSDYGHAVRTLQTTKNDAYKLTMMTDISWLFLSDKRTFNSEFKLKDNRVQPLVFSYSRTGTGSDKSFAARFDYDQQRLVNQANDKAVGLEWNANRLDEASALVQLQRDVAQADKADSKTREWQYNVVDEKGADDTLKFRWKSKKEVQLPYGTLETIVVERVRENSSRVTDYWFAPELNYNLVRMYQAKDGDETATLELKNYETTAQ